MSLFFMLYDSCTCLGFDYFRVPACSNSIFNMKIKMSFNIGRNILFTIITYRNFFISPNRHFLRPRRLVNHVLLFVNRLVYSRLCLHRSSCLLLLRFCSCTCICITTAYIGTAATITVGIDITVTWRRVGCVVILVRLTVCIGIVCGSVCRFFCGLLCAPNWFFDDCVAFSLAGYFGFCRSSFLKRRNIACSFS